MRQGGIGTGIRNVAAGAMASVIVICCAATLYAASPQVAEKRYETTPARLERGKYLTENLLLCFRCHSTADWKQEDTPIIEGTHGAGGVHRTRVGPLVAPNLTPDPETGLGDWTDTEIARALREGISRDGRVLAPEMPYPYFARLTDEDLASIVVYLRSIPAIKKAPAPNQASGASLAAKGQTFQHLDPIKSSPPDRKTQLGRGQYLVEIGHCADCHTPKDADGHRTENLLYAGGQVRVGPWGTVATGNITPDASGISYYDEKIFLEVMRTGKVGGARKLNPNMGWPFYRHMTDDDLKAIWAYMKTVKPVKHRVDNTEKPTLCKLCNQEHGLGDQN